MRGFVLGVITTIVVAMLVAFFAGITGRITPPPRSFGMMKEHDSAGELVRQIRRATSEYTPPADACSSFQALYRELQEFETDLHEHGHLENNILFQRAIELEFARG